MSPKREDLFEVFERQGGKEVSETAHFISLPLIDLNHERRGKLSLLKDCVLDALASEPATV